MLVVHHLGVSQGERVVWLCEELEIPYKLIVHTRDPYTSPESLKSVPSNHTGRAPFLEDPEAGITLSESGAICEYIIARYGNGRFSLQTEDKSFPDYLHWLHYANATSMSSMVVSMFVDLAGLPTDVMPGAFAANRLQANFKLMDERLKSNKWLAGTEFTAADIMNVYSVTTHRYWGPRVSLASYPNLLRWLKDCSERPAYKKAMEKGDPEMKVLVDAEPPKVGMMESGGVKSDHWKK